MATKRGNPNFGKRVVLKPAGAAAFDEVVAQLGLSPTEYAQSISLKQWVQNNKNTKYVPPALLKIWGFEVED